MKKVTVSVPLKLSEILMRRLIGCIYGIHYESFEEKSGEDAQRVINVLLGKESIGKNLKTSINRLKEEDENIDPDAVLVDIALKAYAKKMFGTGKIIKGKRSELGDVIELLCSNWMKMDEIFAVELLAKLDPLVQRTMEIRGIFADDEPPKNIRKYLAEATRCYLYGFYQACIALCRATIEAVLELKLRDKGWNISMIVGDKKGEILSAMIRVAREKGIIDENMYNYAHSIRKKGNFCLHQRQIYTSKKALECIRNTREILEFIYEDETTIKD